MLAWQGAAVEETNLTVQIASLRKHLGTSPGGADWIATIPRVGYRFVGAVDRQADQPHGLVSDADEPGGRPSIAVLPFLNLSDDREQEYFADGIAEDIITGLSRLRWLFVIARNSTYPYKGKAPDVREVARELGVRYVLEGSVRRAGDRLRVTSHLVDASTGATVWADRYDRPAADVFAVQDEITGNVVASLEPQLYAAENQRLQVRPPESLDAWGHVMRAMPQIWTWAEEDSVIGAGRSSPRTGDRAGLCPRPQPAGHGPTFVARTWAGCPTPTCSAPRWNRRAAPSSATAKTRGGTWPSAMSTCCRGVSDRPSTSWGGALA